MCSTGPFQYRWLKGYIYSSCYYHHQIVSIHLSYCYHIFCRGCVPEMFVYIICCHLLHIRSGKAGNLFSLLLCSLWWVQIVGYVSPCRSYSLVCTVHQPIIIIVQNYLNTLNLYILCLIIIIISEVWTITHCLGLGHETMVCAVCLSIFLPANCEQLRSGIRAPIQYKDTILPSYQHRKSHCGDKAILRPSYLRNGISYTGKMVSLLWIRAQDTYQITAKCCLARSGVLSTIGR